jgi:hydroxymethylglutaryl-CoA lyase
MAPLSHIVRREDFNSSTPLKLCEVSPRDGLQSEAQTLGLEVKRQLIADLMSAGVRNIEIGSFVKSVPQLMDTDALVQSLAHHPLRAETHFSGLIFNSKGLKRALAAGVDGVCIVAIPSDSFSQRNAGISAQEGLKQALNLVDEAKANNLFVRVDLATAWVCPFEGQMRHERVFEFASCFLNKSNVDEVALADTLGHAHPLQVHALFSVLGDRYGTQRLAAHFHDTQGMALANVVAAYSAGIRIYDSSLGGLGGCPFAPGASGNLATEDFLLMAQKFADSGVAGIQLEALWKIISNLEKNIGRSLGGRSRQWWHSNKK